MRSLFCCSFALVLAAAACGGEDRPEGDCLPSSSSDRYLPYQVGFTWTYEVTNLDLQETSTKTQSVTGTMDNPDDGMPMFTQVTNKAEGRTDSWMRLQGDALVRIQQEDYSLDSQLERTTVYDPPRIRLDEASERIADGATFAETYTAIIYDPNDIETSREDRTEQWEVLGVDVPCPGDFAAYDCLQLERARIGTPPKTFWYARGVGKVREEGGQVEQLTACSLD